MPVEEPAAEAEAVVVTGEAVWEVGPLKGGRSGSSDDVRKVGVGHILVGWTHGREEELDQFPRGIQLWPALEILIQLV